MNLRKFVPCTLSAAALLLVGACALQRAQEAAEAKTSMVGLSQERVLACMGAPAQTAMAGNTIVWTYDSGNGRTDTFGTASVLGGRYSATAIGSAVTTSRYCKVNVVMSGGRVTRVNYLGPTGGLLTGDEQCAFAVNACLRERAPAQVSDSSSVPSVAAVEPGDQSATVSTSSLPRACTAEDRRMSEMAKRNGYQYTSDCK